MLLLINYRKFYKTFRSTPKSALLNQLKTQNKWVYWQITTVTDSKTMAQYVNRKLKSKGLVILTLDRVII